MRTSSSDVSGEALGRSLLGRLLDRIERQPNRVNRVSVALPVDSLLYDDRQALYGLLTAAEKAGAVHLQWGKRENSHNIAKVVLSNPSQLYAFLGRSSTAALANAATETLIEQLPDLTPKFWVVIESIRAGWAMKRNVVRDLNPGDTEVASRVIRAAQSLVARERDDGMDIRTFSRRTTGNSKFVEAHQGKVADVLRLATDVPPDLNAREVLAFFGIKRFQHACLIAGSIAYRGVALPTEPYIGIAPEMAQGIEVIGNPAWVLTVENLASFNRHVREVRGEGIVVYTGGFPSDATLSAISAITATSSAPVFHWGDVDPGGTVIAYCIEQAVKRVGRNLRLHMMSPELAIRRGQPAPPERLLSNTDYSASVTRGLVDFLSSETAHHLEQEELDPELPGVGCN